MNSLAILQGKAADSTMAGHDRPAKPIQVIYIAGYGRSGTTLLDITLDQHPAVAGAGEVATLSRHVWTDNEYCACGQRANQCQLWGPIGRQWNEKIRSGWSLAEYKHAQEKTETILSPSRLLRRTLNRRLFRSYARDTLSLFEAIRCYSGKEIIVDSSKLPGRALALASIPGIDLFVIHLVRDGRGVAWSMLQSYQKDIKAGLQREIKPKSVVRTAVRWCIVNITTEMLRWRLGNGRYVRVKYEDFVTDPAPALDMIGKMTGIDLAEIAKGLQSGEPIKPAHQIAGNRLRMNKSIRLVGDEAWRTQMPAKERAVFDRLGGWLLQRYGYVR